MEGKHTDSAAGEPGVTTGISSSFLRSAAGVTGTSSLADALLLRGGESDMVDVGNQEVAFKLLMMILVVLMSADEGMGTK